MDWKEEAFELLEKLVSIPSINPGEKPLDEALYGEKAVGDKLLCYFKEYLPDFSYWKEEVLPERFNCFASYVRGENYPTILLETHLDTVDVKGMTVEPFTLTRQGNKWFGRGACDAKGQLTAMIIGLRKALEEQDGKLPVNIILAAVVDEEHKHRGVDHLVEQSVSADLAIVGEPTQLEFGAFHKGSIRFVLETIGKNAHSSTPWNGENAVEKMAEVVMVLKEDAKQAVEGIVHPLCGKSSLSVTLISGGEQVNIIPDQCSIHVDRRLNPQENWQESLDDLRLLVKQKVSFSLWEDLVWQKPYLIDPPLTNDLSTRELVALSDVIQQIRPDFDFVGLQFGCDASKIQPAGIPTVVFGPGSINEAHTADEWIDADELMEAVDIYSTIFQTYRL
ncbi:M20/M25/M40 family metallo-hydrolase [Pseudogracilibacillus sp. SE30717A]|uniref:M20 family metallopeptidase n=1 Tax=Pseudogracilibacillus sp. SE30717A TaxID=3098293 RepID=UPI00300DC66A